MKRRISILYFYCTRMPDYQKCTYLTLTEEMIEAKPGISKRELPWLKYVRILGIYESRNIIEK